MSRKFIAMITLSFSFLLLVSCTTSSTVMKQTDRKNQSSTSLKPISEEEAAKIVDACVKQREKENEKLAPAGISLLGYSVSQSKLYYNKDKKLVWDYMIQVQYKDDKGIIPITRGVVIDAITGEVLDYYN